MALMTGGCHCGNIAVFFETDIMPEETEPRACQCSFCRKHQSRAVSDPGGSLRITVGDGELLSRYRFGLRSIDFLVCRACGVYVAVEETHAMPSVSCAEQLISALGKAVDMTSHAPVMLPSGAGHVAMAMASLCETGMLFVRCGMASVTIPKKPFRKWTPMHVSRRS